MDAINVDREAESRISTNHANVTNLENLEAYEPAGLQPASCICAIRYVRAIRNWAAAKTVNKKWAPPYGRARDYS